MSSKELILSEYDEKKDLYGNFAGKMKQLLEEMLANDGISYNAATCRLKSRDSLCGKIERKQNKYACLAELTDIAAVRIITYYSDDVDRVAALVESEFEVDHDNSIDKRKALEPDRFGYCSVHYVVSLSQKRIELPEYLPYKGLKCEIQIRTVLQHAWAEIEHDLGYKSETAIPRDVRRNFSRLAGLLEIGDKEFLEIRRFLSSYGEKVAEKISEDELNDQELDAVILRELVKTDKDIIRINQEIEAVSTSTLVHGQFFDDCEEDILRLHWLNIRNLRELKEMVRRNEDTAVKIAQILMTEKGEKRTESYIEETIALYYLCLAELLKKNHSYQSILNFLTTFLEDNRESFARELLEIQKQLNL